MLFEHGPGQAQTRRSRTGEQQPPSAHLRRPPGRQQRFLVGMLAIRLGRESWR
jgi:hypothetical protein